MRSNRSVLEAEIRRLDDLGLDDLRKLSGQLLGTTPANHSTRLLRRRLAYELQERVLGDLSPETQRRLQRLRQSFKTNPHHKPLSKHHLKPGTVLTRNWRGVLHQVRVTDQGFDYRGEKFSSLSEAARRITGTRWSGPAFFGLRRGGRAAP